MSLLVFFLSTANRLYVSVLFSASIYPFSHISCIHINQFEVWCIFSRFKIHDSFNFMLKNVDTILGFHKFNLHHARNFVSSTDVSTFLGFSCFINSISHQNVDPYLHFHAFQGLVQINWLNCFNFSISQSQLAVHYNHFHLSCIHQFHELYSFLHFSRFGAFCIILHARVHSKPISQGSHKVYSNFSLHSLFMHFSAFMNYFQPFSAFSLHFSFQWVSLHFFMLATLRSRVVRSKLKLATHFSRIFTHKPISAEFLEIFT